MNIDKRKTYYITLDTEGANSIEMPFAYDLGFAIHDKHGNIYHQENLVIFETFYQMQMFMKNAYYADKLPQYHEEIALGIRKVVTIQQAKEIFNTYAQLYNVRAVIAYNMPYDYRALTNAIRNRHGLQEWFFTFDYELWDSLKMARQTICKQKSYREFCENNGFTWGKNNKNLRTSAEVVYRYLTQDLDFEEKHTGLEDVKIEVAIFAKVMRQHKKMEPLAFSKKDKKEG